MYCIAECSFILLFAFLAEIKLISWDAAIISMAIIIAAVILCSTIEEKMSAFISTIKKQMKTRQNNDSKDEKDNERN